MLCILSRNAQLLTAAQAMLGQALCIPEQATAHWLHPRLPQEHRLQTSLSTWQLDMLVCGAQKRR